VNLRHWFGNIVGTMSETGTVVDTVRLITVADGQLWQTWTSAALTEDWPEAAELQLRELAAEWPAQPHQVRFVAESAGVIVSVAPLTVQGTSKQALAAEVSQQKALADAAAVQAKTMNTILEASNVQINMLLSTVETMGKRVDSLVEVVQRSHEGATVSDEIQARAMTLLENAAPRLLAAAVQHYTKKD